MIDVSSRQSVRALVEAATAIGSITGVIHAAGVSPSQASPATIELTGPRGEGYRRMIELCPVGRAGTPDEVGTLGALLMSQDGAFITGSDFLMDGGVTAAYWYGELAPR
jgi:NAD(P)-dependent dehydrogenase (short-subunit alcohol dehydrogenase family)